ncbi:hypothetical protein L8P27_01215 [Enterobacter asburiae]|jgi:hypothetical protein|uniref:hypothetical protein n=1 Tax=Enterobacter asburiae TaxID=61645 RepID=UPI0020035C72|nr:hypothetical protein [Enterobacter asburiae]MCK7226480.1 hypothetical protein [Enterobacter asburiae]
MKIQHYTVLIVIEAPSSDNNINPLILSLLHDRKYSNKSNRGVKLPSHVFVGLEGQAISEWESEKDGAEKLKKRLYHMLHGIIRLETYPPAIFLMICPEDKTLTFVSRLKFKK